MKIPLRVSWLLLLLMVPASSLAANRYLMAGLGDSITAALLATTTLEAPDSSGLLLINFGLSDLLSNRDTLSWSTGSLIRSHFIRVRDALASSGDSGELIRFNTAYPGDTSRQFFIQAEKVVAKAELEGFTSVKYMTVMFGANDVCTHRIPGGVPEAEMKMNLERGFGELAELPQSEPIRILVGGLPRIPDLGKPAILSRRTLGGITCAEFRANIINSCAPLVDWTNDEEYRRSLATIQRRNAVIQEAVNDARKAHPNLDIVYTNEMYDWPISYNLLAVDCFHPNSDGQELISGKLWAAQPWYH